MHPRTPIYVPMASAHMQWKCQHSASHIMSHKLILILACLLCIYDWFCVFPMHGDCGQMSGKEDIEQDHL